MMWEDDEATREYGWLRNVAAPKYDGYADFRAGSRFIESLAAWLLQFEQADRDVAYKFVRNRLVYVSAAEMERVIEAFVPEVVTPYLRRLAAEGVGIAAHEVWGSADGAAKFKSLLRRCLFVGLSDGGRIDILRRTNAGLLSQEQIVPMMHVDSSKWDDLATNLSEAEGSDARFEHVYLIDDFTASGTTFIRHVNGQWKGKLNKFNKLVVGARKDHGDAFPIAKDFIIHIHHYVSTQQARNNLMELVENAQSSWSDRSYSEAIITEGLLLPPQVKLEAGIDDGMIDLCRKYYDHGLYERLKRHCEEAGQSDMMFGYAGCTLPVVLEHNTPNNSIPLLWAETTGSQGHAMRPLFRRRDRHG